MDKLFPSFLVYQELNLVSIGLTRRRVDFSPGQQSSLRFLRMILDELVDILKRLIQLTIQKDAMGGFRHVDEPLFF